MVICANMKAGRRYKESERGGGRLNEHKLLQRVLVKGFINSSLDELVVNRGNFHESKIFRGWICSNEVGVGLFSIWAGCHLSLFFFQILPTSELKRVGSDRLHLDGGGHDYFGD